MPTFLKVLGRELLINLEFSKNYRNGNQNDIQSASFGNNSFSLFTACAFYKNQDKTKKVSVAINPEARDKSRVTSLSCAVFLIQFLRSEIEKATDTVYIFLDGCAAQFRSRYVFCLLADFQKDMTSYDVIILRHISVKVPWMVQQAQLRIWSLRKSTTAAP